jgi:hypothetical protein
VAPQPETSVLECVRTHRERFDFEISEQTGIPLDTVRLVGARLIASGAVMSCTVTRYEDGAPREIQLYRISGYLPPPAPGRRAKPRA